MSNPSFPENRGELNQLIQQYQHLKNGESHTFFDEDAFEKVIDYYTDKDDFKEAQTAATLALRQFPYSADLMYKKADMLIANRKYEKALDLLDQASVYDSNNISLYILKTDAFLALDRQSEAIETLQDALPRFEGEEKIDLLFELADVFDDYEQFDKIFDCLKLILELEPNNEEALYKVCFWADFTGRIEESITLHHTIINEFPYNEIAWFNLAAGYQSLKLYEKAIDAYQYAIVIDEKFDYAYRNLGDAYLRLRKYKEAIEALEKVLELSKPEDVIYEAIGHCYHRLGNIAQARFNYKKAVHLNNNDGKLQYKLATTYMQDEQWIMAIKHLENALRFNKNSKDFNLAMGECKMQQGLFTESIVYFGLIVRNKPTYAIGWEALIKSFLKANLKEEALQLCKNALLATQQKPFLFFYYSAVLFLNGKNKEAYLQLEHAMKIAPRKVKKFLDLLPNILQNHQVVGILARHKKTNKKL